MRWRFILAGLSALVLLFSQAPLAHADQPGSVFGWGLNKDGELGTGTHSNSPLPVAVDLDPDQVRELVTGGSGAGTSYALLQDGTVMAWGYGSLGELGNGSLKSSAVPVPVPGLHDVVAIAAGDADGFALMGNGTVMGWGWNYDGTVGVGTTTQTGCGCIPTPTPVQGLSDVKSIAAHFDNALAVLENGTVKDWGGNGNGQLGIGSIGSLSASPVTVDNLSGVESATVGGNFNVALLYDGRVMSWGANSGDQLGDGVPGNGTTTDEDLPVPVLGFGKVPVQAISSGEGHTLARLVNGTVMDWGANTQGQLGDGSTTDVDVAQAIPQLPRAKEVSAGYESSVALLNDGGVMSFGLNDVGQLGTGEVTTAGCGCVVDPVQTLVPNRVSNVTAGGRQSFAWGSSEDDG